MPYIKRVKEGSETVIPLKNKKLTIGREVDCDIVVDKYADISREHCGFTTYDDGVVTLLDYGSKNGTYLNGEQIFEETKLKDGDKVKVCNELVFTFHTDVGNLVTEAKDTEGNDFVFNSKSSKAAFELEQELENRSFKDLMDEIVQETRPKNAPSKSKKKPPPSDAPQGDWIKKS